MSEQQRSFESTTPTPLNPYEVMAMVGADATMVGTYTVEIRLLGWITIATGSAVIQIAGMQGGICREWNRLESALKDQNRPFGVALATIGCLLGLAFVNPFQRGTPASVQEFLRIYEDELQLVRWLYLAAAIICIVAGFQFPRQSVRILQNEIKLAGLFIGAGVFVMAAVIFTQVWPQFILVGIAWTGFCVASLMILESSQPFARWKTLIIASPFIATFGLLLMSGEFQDLYFILCMPTAVVVGYIICRGSEFPQTAVLVATFGIGLPVALVAITGVDGVITDLLDMNAAEFRFVAVGISFFLARSMLLAMNRSKLNETTRGPIK